MINVYMCVKQNNPYIFSIILWFYRLFTFFLSAIWLACFIDFFPDWNVTHRIRYSYVHGIGSETRNSLFHLHNARDLVLVTTCRHGKSWRELQDARCDEDNREYDR